MRSDMSLSEEKVHSAQVIQLLCFYYGHLSRNIWKIKTRHLHSTARDAWQTQTRLLLGSRRGLLQASAACGQGPDRTQCNKRLLFLLLLFLLLLLLLLLFLFLLLLLLDATSVQP
jgi:hypothetical protein